MVSVIGSSCRRRSTGDSTVRNGTAAGSQRVLPETVEAVPVGAASTKRRLKVQDLETEEFPEEEPADFQEGPVETEKIQLIENPLPLPKKHVPKVLDYKLNGDDDSDFDYPVADDDDFDH